MADESSEIRLQHDLQFSFRAAERSAQRVLPRGRPQTLERHDGTRRDRDEAGQARRAGVADESAVAKTRPGKRGTAAAFDTTVEPRAVPHRVHAARDEAHGDAAGGGSLHRPLAPHEKRVETDVWITL